MSDFQYQRYEDPSNQFFESSASNSSYKPTQNLDRFLTKVYHYYLGKGFFSITLSKASNLLILLWIAFLVVILSSYIDYTKLFGTYNLHTAFYYQGMHPLVFICLVLFCTYWVKRCFKFFLDVRTNVDIRNFYHGVLRISEEELQTIEWREVVQKLIQVPRLSLAKSQVTPLDVANRIMRKENYLIAMINKGVLQLNIPLPFLRNRTILTKTMEWGLNNSIFPNIFDQDTAIIDKKVLDPSRRSEAVASLQKSFRIVGIVTFVFSPFLFVFYTVYFLFQHGEEIRNQPSSFASRQWSPLARWKFRELNELHHLFEKRLNGSHSLATKYVASFPYPVLETIARFVSFIVGSLMVILLFFGVWDDDTLFKLEVLENRSAIWFIGIGGSIIALCRSFIPNEKAVMEPEKTMEEIVQYTHYMPKHWHKQLHTTKVLSEFTQLFEYKITILATEILSVLFLPLIFFFSLPQSANNIIDFFEKFTVDEPGVGNVCKFAVFPLKEHGNRRYGVETVSPSKDMQTRHGKLEKSFLNFQANYPEWRAPTEGEKYLSTLEQSINSSILGSAPADGLHASMTSSLSRDKWGQDSQLALSKIHQYFYNAHTDGHSV